MAQHIHGFRNKSSHGTSSGPGSRQYFVNNPADMGDYLREFEHTFMFEFADIFLSKIGSLSSVVPEGSEQMYDLSELLHQKDQSYL